MSKYWHFMADNNGAPIMRDGVTPIVGQRYEIDGEVELCERGYHGSKRAIDALYYAPGPWVSLRELEDAIDDKDKSVGRAFVQTRYIDATDTLREFARGCALQVIDLWDAQDVVRQYLETGDESLRSAARDAAWEAAWGAARDAARDAAWDAARDAAWDAARDAAWDAVQAVVRSERKAVQDAAWGAAWGAAWAAQNKKLGQMLYAALQEAEHGE